MAEALAAKDGAFAFELVKLLLQVVWADGAVAEEEAEALHDFAVRAGADAARIEALDACLSGRQPLPPPNLGLLRERRIEVLQAVRQLVTSDARVHEEEEELIAEISALLG
jgi:uncharacterized tellurite resistance protein B-like protein